MADHRDTPVDQTRTSGEPVHDDVVHTEDRREVVSREREEHGGVKIGSAFFGWLAATGMAVLLSAVLAATGLLAGEATGTDSASEAAGTLDLQVEELSVIGVVVALAIWFVAYYCGGYVAGRMARFDGVKQGVAVWLWAIVVAVAIGVLAWVAGDDYSVASGLPEIDVETATTPRVLIGVVVVALTSLAGAMLGGLAGMRFHRKVDRTGLGR
jgi:hypothetical protein